MVPAGFNEDRTVTMFQVLPEEGPNAVSTEELVRELRAKSHMKIVSLAPEVL